MQHNVSLTQRIIPLIETLDACIQELDDLGLDISANRLDHTTQDLRILLNSLQKGVDK